MIEPRAQIPFACEIKQGLTECEEVVLVQGIDPLAEFRIKLSALPSEQAYHQLTPRLVPGQLLRNSSGSSQRTTPRPRIALPVNASFAQQSQQGRV